MKKKILLTVVALILSILLLSCGKTADSECEFVFASSSYSGTDEKLSCMSFSGSIWNELESEHNFNKIPDNINEKLKGSSATITVNGCNYKAEFSQYCWYSKYGVPAYKYESDNLEFKVSVSDGTLLGFYDDNFRHYYHDGDVITVTAEEGEAIAREYLRSITDIDNYKTCSINDTADGMYSYTFARYINGIKTCEDIYIKVSSVDKKILTYSSYYLGVFRDAKLPESFDVEKYIESAVEKTEGLLKDNSLESEFSVALNRDESFISIYEDGTMYYNAHVFATSEEETILITLLAEIK